MAEFKENREGWSNRMGFLCAAIGSAVGLGNVWRFPNLSYTYGGGAFFLPYLLAMVFIGIPLLTLEFALGQVYRSGDIVAFGAISKRLRGVGIGSIWCGFMVVCYYVVIIAWAITMLVNSVQSGSNPDEFKWTTYEGGPVSFFLEKVVGLGDQTLPDGSLRRSTNIVPQTFAGVTFVWLCIFLCTFKGPKLVGRITYVTMIVPLALLLVIACFFGSLDGASDGVEQYIGKWDLNKLSGSQPECQGRPCDQAWPDAVAQVFFSLSVTFGVMTAYASYNPVSQGVQVDALACAAGDVAASFLAGFAVFASIGVAAKAAGAGTTAEDLAAGSGGLGLVFWALPSSFEALGQEPFNFDITVRKFWAALFYLTVVLLGIDSAFSLCEGFSTCVKDSRLLKGVPREAIIGLVCILGYIISILGYCNDTGLFMLDTVDYYINVTMLFVGFMETFSAGWIAYRAEHVERIGQPAWFTMLTTMLLVSTVVPWVGLGIGSFSEHAENGTWTSVVLGFAVFAAGTVASVRMAREKTGGTVSSALYDVLLLNVERLRGEINGLCGSAVGNVSIPLMWSVLIKFFIPPVLMFMLQIKFHSPVFGDYEGYHQWYQGWGVAVAFLPFLILAIGLTSPDKFDDLLPEQDPSLAHEQVAIKSADAAQVASERAPDAAAETNLPGSANAEQV